MCRTSMSSVYACTQLKKQGRKHGLTVTSARLPSGCACCSVAATCGHHRWDWAFPHSSHKQRTHCLVSVFSQFFIFDLNCCTISCNIKKKLFEPSLKFLSRFGFSHFFIFPVFLKLAFLFIFFVFLGLFFSFGQVKGNALDIDKPTKVFELVKSILRP